MGTGPNGLDWAIIGAIVVATLLVLVVLAVILYPVFKGVGWALRRIGSFIGGEVVDLLRMVGALIAGLIFGSAALFNLALQRSPSAEHYLKALQAEGEVLIGCLYRVFVGHPAKLLSLTPLTEIIEQRVPQVLATAPGTSSARSGRFDGYTIVGTLPPGGSGARLYVAEPSQEKRAELARAGGRPVDRVVIKSFILGDGSTLPQIIRESRALTAASQLGLVLDHELSASEFHYVTRYEPGEPLTQAIRRLHEQAGAGGLRGEALRTGLGYIADLLRTLRAYHAAALWHKDVKPDNIIVSEGAARLVDCGLVTPLHSGLTLTTHGTEYFRDPEMVRLALRGAKVQDVDGARFDVYGAGAVLYALVENTFPAHGGLSRMTKPCPDAVRWIVARAMAEYDKRYGSAAAMLADVERVLRAGDPFAVRIGELPSVMGEDADLGSVEPPAPAVPVAADASGASPSVTGPGSHIDSSASVTDHKAAPLSSAPDPPRSTEASGASEPRAQRPSLRVTNWWTGRYDADP